MFQFRYGGEIFRVRFRHDPQGCTPSQPATTCIVEQEVVEFHPENAPKYSWRLVAVGDAHRFHRDQFSKSIGRRNSLTNALNSLWLTNSRGGGETEKKGGGGETEKKARTAAWTAFWKASAKK